MKRRESHQERIDRINALENQAGCNHGYPQRKTRTITFPTQSSKVSFYVQLKCLNDEEVEVEVECDDYEVENDGIGSYECHGFRGYDRGTDYAVPTKITLISVDGRKDLDSLTLAEEELIQMERNGELDYEIECYEETEPD